MKYKLETILNDPALYVQFYEERTLRIDKKIGELAREIRLRHNLTQLLLSESIAMSDRQLRHIEQGNKASLEEISRLFYYMRQVGYMTVEDIETYDGYIRELLSITDEERTEGVELG